jgi:hypothetical protein
MADINDMTRPLKKYEHGGLHEELPYDRSKSRMENENILMRDIGGTLMDKFKGLFKKKQYEGGDDPEYMKKFNFLWKQGFSERQIRAIMSGEVNQTDIVPERVEYDFDKEKSFVPEGEFRGAKGGLASISQMTRPVHMAGGGDPELKGLLKALTIQLMLEKGMEGSTLMPSGNPDKIKRLEDKIQAIKIELGE